jgi:hypothetical protein
MSTSIVERAKNIIFKPASEWSVIAKEPATIGELFRGFALPLTFVSFVPTVSAIAAHAAGIAVPFYEYEGMGLGVTIALTFVSFIISLTLLYFMIYTVRSISPRFQGTSDEVQVAKLVIYAATPAWAATWLDLIPIVGEFLSAVAHAYVIYVIYLGLRTVLGVPQDKLVVFTLVVVVVYFLLLMLIAGTVAMLIV